MARLGAPREVRRLESSPRSRVWRADLPLGPVVIKQAFGGDDPEVRFRREITALNVAAQSAVPVTPRLLGVDATERVMVLDYLAAGPPVPDWPVAYARAMAHLHAVGGPETPLPRVEGPTDADISAFLRLAAALAVQVPPGATGELEGAVRRLHDPAHTALLHGDPCPDNTVLTAAGLRLIDFEQAAVGNGITELAYLWMGFPTCWCSQRISAAQLTGAEQAYQRTWLRLTGRTSAAGALTDACLGWLLRADALVERARRGSGTDLFAALMQADWQWGRVSARQRLLHRLRVTSTRTATRSDLAAVHRLTAAMADQLPRRWPQLRPLPDWPGKPDPDRPTVGEDF